MRAWALLAAGLWIGLPPAALSNTTVESASEALELKIGAAVKITLARDIKTAFISSPEVARYQVVTEREMLVFGLGLGRAALFVMDDLGETIYSARLEVVPDLSEVRRTLNDNYPGLDVTVEAAANGKVVLNGRVPDAVTAADVLGLVDAFLAREGQPAGTGSGEASGAQGDAGAQGEEGGTGDAGGGVVQGQGVGGGEFGRILNRLTVTGGGQVTINVRFAEVRRDISERLGLQWRGLQFRAGAHEFAFAESPIFVGLEPDELGALTGSSSNLTGLIDVLAVEQFVSVLAEPNLSVTSGETASFLSGGEIPFPVFQEDGIGIEFRPFGVLLDVTPTILADNRISLRIRPEVSEPSVANGIVIQGQVLPGLSIRRADTTVELASGQSFALAGLLESDLEDTVAKFPFLGDIPLFGALARSSDFQRGDSELVIIATASIAEPTYEALAVPNENIELAGLFTRLFLGRTYVPRNAVPQGCKFLPHLTEIPTTFDRDSYGT